jgi:hypothetical protein
MRTKPPKYRQLPPELPLQLVTLEDRLFEVFWKTFDPKHHYQEPETKAFVRSVWTIIRHSNLQIRYPAIDWLIQ